MTHALHQTAPPEVSHRRILSIAVPMIFAHVTTPLLGIVSTAAIGRLGDPIALAAVALGAVIMDMLVWAFAFLRMFETLVMLLLYTRRGITSSEVGQSPGFQFTLPL